MSERILYIDLNDYAETEIKNKDKEIQRLNTIITNQNGVCEEFGVMAFFIKPRISDKRDSV